MKKTGLLVFLVVAVGCKNPKEKLYEMYHERVSSAGELTDEMVVKYIRTYKILKKKGQDYVRFAGDAESGKQGFAAIDGDIKSGGFKDYAEFVKVNAKIAWAWNMAQAAGGMQKQAKLQEWGQGQMDAGMKQVQDAINDPEVPESAKQALRKQLEEMSAGKQKLASEYAKNVKWANKAMALIKPLTNDKEIAVVMRHEKELMMVYSGLTQEQLEQIQQVSMDQLGIK